MDHQSLEYIPLDTYLESHPFSYLDILERYPQDLHPVHLCNLLLILPSCQTKRVKLRVCPSLHLSPLLAPWFSPYLPFPASSPGSVGKRKTPACAIQSSISSHGSDDAKCRREVLNLYKCCEAVYAASAGGGGGSNGQRQGKGIEPGSGSTACPIRKVVERRFGGLQREVEGE